MNIQQNKRIEALERLVSLFDTNEIYIADIFAEFNNKERAFYWMHKAIDNLAPDATMFINKPIYNKWKNEPEYLELLKKANLDKQ